MMNADFFLSNRHALQEKLGGGALVVLAGYGEMQRSNDAAWPFEQEGNFWYLSGINSPEWWLIIQGDKTWAIAPTIDAVKQAFDGSLSPEAAKKISGASHVIDRDEAMSLLRRQAKLHSIVYTTTHSKFVREHSSFYLNPAQTELQTILERTFQKVEECNKQLAQLRTIKQPFELDAIKLAIKYTVDALKNVKENLSKFKYEYEIEAEISYLMRKAGADGQAWNPIVAAGANACTLHYAHNDAKLVRQSLLLLDVGAKHGGYAADISRTYALGNPTPRQRHVHDAVRAAQSDIISRIEPGLQFSEYQKMVESRMGKALGELKLDESKVYDYMPHAIGHGLGVDVHDTMAGYDSFQPGMVLTVEPGIYLHDEGIGVRIEDDVLVTRSGNQVLSKALSLDI